MEHSFAQKRALLAQLLQRQPEVKDNTLITSEFKEDNANKIEEIENKQVILVDGNTNQINEEFKMNLGSYKEKNLYEEKIYENINIKTKEKKIFSSEENQEIQISKINKIDLNLELKEKLPKNSSNSSPNTFLAHEETQSPINKTYQIENINGKNDVEFRLRNKSNSKIADPVEFNVEVVEAKKAERKITHLISEQDEMNFQSPWDPSKMGEFDNFQGTVRDSFLCLQSNESIDTEFDDYLYTEEYLDPIKESDIFKNECNGLGDCNTITLNQILSFMDKYKTITWVQLMKIMQLNIIDTMDTSQLYLQNFKFELIATEWSYLKTLKTLDYHFISKLVISLSRNEFIKLFGFIKNVTRTSELFLKDIEDSWQRNVFLPDFFEILCKNIESNFESYIHYCGNRPISEEILKELLSKPERAFSDILQEIQTDLKCEGMHLHAFLLKPIQKIRHFPFIIENFFNILEPKHSEFEPCEKALKLLRNLLEKCTNAEKLSKEKLMVTRLNNKIKFSKNMKMTSIGDLESRRFIHSGEVELLEVNSTIFKKPKLVVKPVHLFLFNDLLLVTKKSSAIKFVVITYCNLIQLEINADTVFSPSLFETVNEKIIFYIKIRENHDNKPMDLCVLCKSATEKIRWTEAMDPMDSKVVQTNTNYNVNFRVTVKTNFAAKQADELSIFIGNKIQVFRTYNDGWYFGQRFSDKQSGWFPTEHVQLENRQ